MTALRRAGQPGRPAAPVRLVHLGLGNFFRAHQAWYTQRSPDAEDWGYAAFAGTDRGDLPARLMSQDGLYTLVTRAADGDTVEVVDRLSRTHPAAEQDAWLGYFASPALGAVTATVTEAGYLRRPDGGLDVDRSDVQADLAALRHDPTAPVRTAPARLVAGLAARRRADAGPLSIVPCDNLPGNGTIVGTVVRDFARLLDPGLEDWIDASLSVVTTVVDRITPRATDQDAAVVRAATGVDDRCVVITEPFAEWVLSGAFPAGRPDWGGAGAVLTEDATPFEHRKLWLLNAGHSLLAYAGSIRGHATVADAVADDTCRGWLDEWWALAAGRLGQPDEDVGRYCAALSERFANPRIRHRLDQVGSDGSQKLPVRVLPVLHAERAAGRVPVAATRILAAWICCLRGLGAPVSDVLSAELVDAAAGELTGGVRRALETLEPGLGEDAEVVAAVTEQCGQFAAVR